MARLHPDEAGRPCFKECQQAVAPNASLDDEMSGVVDTVDLENRLGEIETGGCDRHDWLLMMVVPTSLHRDIADEVVHAIKWAISRRYMPMEKLTAECTHTDAAPMISAQ